MAILGIESVIFGVEDLELCTRFWDDFGLVPVARTADESVFEVASGSKVVVRRKDDRRLPRAYFEGPGVRETVWGVDTRVSLETLVTGLARDREVRRDTDGTAHFAADDGMPLALRVWQKRAVVSVPHRVPAIFQTDQVSWDVKLDPDGASLVEFRGPDPQ
jgi:catechol 2,3-dioxygenase-like lactoylglutathione lyase family enzyme